MAKPPDWVTAARGKAADEAPVLVSYAEHEPYESTQRKLNETAVGAGFGSTLMWTRSHFLADPLVAGELNESFAKLDTLHANDDTWPYGDKGPARPFCASVKPLMLLRAMTDHAGEGQYVMWLDSSKYFKNGFTHDKATLQAAIDVLSGRSKSLPAADTLPPPDAPWRAYLEEGAERGELLPRTGQRGRAGPTSMFGVLHSTYIEGGLFHANGDNEVVNLKTLKQFRDLVPADVDRGQFFRRPTVLDSTLILANSPEMRALMWDWLQMAVAKPEGFCSSHTQDQAAWAILVQNRSLPLLNFNAYGTHHQFPDGIRIDDAERAALENSGMLLKSINYLLQLIAHGMYEATTGTDWDDLAHRQKKSLKQVAKRHLHDDEQAKTGAGDAHQGSAGSADNAVAT